jgi:hypothetical protein
MTNQPNEDPTAAIWAARRERARRWRKADSLKGYPALRVEAETEETLAATPPLVEERGKRRKADEPTEE